MSGRIIIFNSEKALKRISKIVPLKSLKKIEEFSIKSGIPLCFDKIGKKRFMKKIEREVKKYKFGYALVKNNGKTMKPGYFKAKITLYNLK